MTNNMIRILAGSIIVKSKLHKEAKTQLLNFIQKEASIEQVMVLILDGRIVQLDEQTSEIVRDRFKVNEAGGRISTMRKTYATQYGSSLGVVPWVLYRKIRSKFDECTKRCGTYELNTARRQVCMSKCKVDKLKAELSALRKAKVDPTKINKKKIQLLKAEETFKKYLETFKKRGSSIKV